MRTIVQDKVLSILPTRRCTAACRSCGSFSNPEAKDKLEAHEITEAIRSASDNDFKLIVFTGGEATLEWDSLIGGIRLASSLSMSTRVVSNGYWATSIREAESTVTKLAEAGLDELNVSTGDEHVRFVPLEVAARAMLVGVRRFKTISVMVEMRREARITSEMVSEELIRQGASSGELQKIDIAPSPWMPISHRHGGHYPEGAVITASNLALREGCSSILKTYTIEPDGIVSSCCGLGANLIGDLHTGRVGDDNWLREAVDASETDLVKLALRYIGPEKLLHWASKIDPSIQWEGRYAHNCQACHQFYRDERVRAVVLERLRDLELEIMSRAVFDEFIYPKTVEEPRMTRHGDAHEAPSSGN